MAGPPRAPRQLWGVRSPVLGREAPAPTTAADLHDFLPFSRQVASPAHALSPPGCDMCGAGKGLQIAGGSPLCRRDTPELHAKDSTGHRSRPHTPGSVCKPLLGTTLVRSRPRGVPVRHFYPGHVYRGPLVSPALLMAWQRAGTSPRPSRSVRSWEGRRGTASRRVSYPVHQVGLPVPQAAANRAPHTGQAAEAPADVIPTVLEAAALPAPPLRDHP